MTHSPDDPAAASPPAVDWSVAKRLFAEALELPADERDGFLSAHSVAQPETVRRVAGLLEAHDRSNGFFVEPKRSSPEGRALPERIGPYRPVERLGEGGFGVVYRAEQVEPIAREVAIKVLRTGLDTPEVLARFHDERQFLAQLDHGDVVKVFDAGVTDDGTAYLVMEFIDGKPVTEFASGLTISERLGLFVRVCRAVQAVHRRGVIHRDLKPSNILVHDPSGDERPRLRIIDFGVAAAVERAGRESMTVVGAPLGTPRYASPEQVRGDTNADTRSDVYALGMILCEMLTGKLPGPPDASQEKNFDRPSMLLPEERATLRGDLDRIVLKAVDREADGRYDSAAALADDIERYLRGEAVLATRPSTLYLARKFIARRRAVAVLLAIASLTTIAGVTALTVGTERARDAEREVRAALAQVIEERDRADAINHFLLGDVIDAMNPGLTGEPIPGTDELLASMSDLGQTVFADMPETAYALLDRVGDAQRSLGLFAAAQESKALAMHAARRAFGPDDERTLGMQLDALLMTGVAADVSQDAEQLAGIAIDTLGANHPVALLASVHALRRSNGPVQPEQVFGLLAQIEAAGFAETELHVRAMVQLRTLLSDQDDPRGLDMLLEAVDLSGRVHGPVSSITLDYIGRAGSALRQAGRHEEAVEILSSACEDARRTYGEHQHVTKMLLNRVAVAALLGGRPEVGLAYGERLYEIAAAPEQTDPYFASIAAMLIARGYEELGRYEDAVPWRRERLERELGKTAAINNHHVPRARLVMTLVGAGHLADAEAEFRGLCEAGGPHDQFRLSAAVLLARAIDDTGRKRDALSLLQAERGSEAYPPDAVEQIERVIERLSQAP